MTTRTADAQAIRAGLPLGRSLVVILAVGQIVSNLVFTLVAPAELESGADVSPIVPPAPMFAIWGVIIASSILWALLQARPSVRGSGLRDALVLPLGLVYAGFSIWLAAASTDQTSPLTIPAFILIVGAHVVAWRRIAAARDELATWRRIDRVALLASEGLYTGWTSIAIFVNVATVVQAAGAPVDGAWGTVWQFLVIAAAAGAAVVFVVLTRGSVWYAAAASYALTGATISAASSGFPVLAVACGVGVALVIGSTVLVRTKLRPPLG